jgi:hypothetical protein
LAAFHVRFLLLEYEHTFVFSERVSGLVQFLKAKLDIEKTLEHPFLHFTVVRSLTAFNIIKMIVVAIHVQSIIRGPLVNAWQAN